jgi:large subunit ribosomal protein L10
MSKAVKAMITRELTEKLKGVNSMVVCSTVGLAGKEDNALRRALHDKKVRLMVVKNSLARLALKGLGITSLDPLLEGPTALAWGAAGVEAKDVASELFTFSKKHPKLQIRGGLLEGEAIDAKGVETVATGPGRKEYIARVIGLALGPAGRIQSLIASAGTAVLGAIRDVEKKAVAAAAPAPAEAPKAG